MSWSLLIQDKSSHIFF